MGTLTDVGFEKEYQTSRTGGGVCVFYTRENHSLSIRAKAWHLVVPLAVNNITRQGVTQMLNKGAVLLTSRSNDGA